MIEFQPSYIFATAVVVFSIVLLIYFAWKTLITSNFYQKGVTHYQQEDFKGAEAAFRQVIAINSTNDVVRLLLGDTLMKQSKVEAAISQFQEVIDRAPKKVDAYVRLANAYMQQEKKQEAKKTLQKAKELFQTQRNPQKVEQIEKVLKKMG
jgi:predicted Zn-dependent protease